MIFHNKRNGVPKPSAFISEDKTPECLTFEALFDGTDDIVHTAMMESMSSLYHGVCSHDRRIVMEGVRDMAKTAYEFFKNIVKKITNFIKNVFDLIASYVADFDKFIDKHSMNASRFKPFDVQGYTYTIKGDQVDNCGISKITDSYNATVGKLKTMSLGDVQAIITKERGKDSMSLLRGKISGNGGAIKEDKFEDALFKQYRDGKDSKHKITVNAGMVNTMISEYKSFKTLAKEVKEDGNNVQSVFNELADFFKEMPQYEYKNSDDREIHNYKLSPNSKEGTVGQDKTTSDNYSVELYKKQIAWYNFCLKLSKDIAYIYSKAYNAKVTALKEAISFNRGVIRKALSPFADKEGGAES